MVIEKIEKGVSMTLLLFVCFFFAKLKVEICATHVLPWSKSPGNVAIIRGRDGGFVSAEAQVPMFVGRKVDQKKG